MNTPKYIILSLILMVVFSCKSAKSPSDTKANYSLSTRQLVKANEKQKASFKTLQAKLRVSYLKNDKEQTHTVSFRAKKDEIIWLSATFSVIRAKITPQKVSFYNKLDNTYFEGDYNYLSEVLGTPLDFQKLQNLLFGEALLDLKANGYASHVNEGLYVLHPKKQPDLLEVFFLLDPRHFKVKSQQFTQPKTFKHFQVDYLAYQEVNHESVPKHIKINAVEGTEETIIKLEFRNVSLNETLRFPFKIPSGFNKIEL